MPEIIDVLTLPRTICPKFTVNTAQDYIDTTWPSLNNYETLENASGQSRFRQGDSFRILSAGFIIPHGFCQRNPVPDSNTTPIIMAFFLYDVSTDAQYNIDVLSFGGHLRPPMENFEMSMDVFCDVTKAPLSSNPAVFLADNFRLKIFKMEYIHISMLNVPPVFNTKVFYCIPFVKVLHNYQLY